MMEQREKVPHRVFVIAGSEPLGSAGIQADIKAISACGGYAAGAVTCVVDEDTQRVKGICPIPVEMVVSQTRSFLEDVGAEALKTGMLYSRELVCGVAELLGDYRGIPLVVDPVMVTSAGDPLLEEEAVHGYREYLIPRATLITPNRHEAEILLGRALNPDRLEEDVAELARWGNAVVVKSIPGEGCLTDLFYAPRQGTLRRYTKPLVETRNVNGTGDMFASAIATYLARGWELGDAIDRAEEFIDNAIRRGAGFSFGSGFGPVCPFYAEGARWREENRRYAERRAGAATGIDDRTEHFGR